MEQLDLDPKMRQGRLRDVINARELQIELGEVLARATTAMRTSIGVLLEYDRAKLRDFCDRMPSTRVAVSLKAAYHKDNRHVWTSNDIHDIDALSIAVTYCDAVFTDKAARKQVMSCPELQVFGPSSHASPRSWPNGLTICPRRRRNVGAAFADNGGAAAVRCSHGPSTHQVAALLEQIVTDEAPTDHMPTRCVHGSCVPTGHNSVFMPNVNVKRGAPGGASGRSRRARPRLGRLGRRRRAWGLTAFRAISRPFLIGRALDGPLLPTVRAAERVRKRRRYPSARHPHRHAHSRTPPTRRPRVSVGPLRPVVVCRVVFEQSAHNARNQAVSLLRGGSNPKHVETQWYSLRDR